MIRRFDAWSAKSKTLSSVASMRYKISLINSGMSRLSNRPTRIAWGTLTHSWRKKKTQSWKSSRRWANWRMSYSNYRCSKRTSRFSSMMWQMKCKHSCSSVRSTRKAHSLTCWWMLVLRMRLDALQKSTRLRPKRGISLKSRRQSRLA